jgi:eukaryotic-like serine/threonine-protein kinase
VIGSLIAHYRIDEKLGEGGMGAVYRALDTKLGRSVALKFIRGAVDISESSRRALVDEARAASALDHPNIGTIFGIEDTPDGLRFIVMAYYEGETLARKLRRGPLPCKEAASIGLQIASGLAEAHRHNIIHRDIKPSNIILTGRLVKIVDFGIARAVQSESSTLSAGMPGTAAYMSPEQAQGKFLDRRTDLWSLGTVLYEMISGRRAFTGDSVPSLLFAIVHDAPPPLEQEIPGEFREIVSRALAKQVEHRYQSAEEMIQDLRRFAESDAIDSDAIDYAPTMPLEEIVRDHESSFTAPLRRTKRRTLLLVLAAIPVIALTGALLTFKHVNRVKPAAYQAYLAAMPYLQRYEKTENLDKAISQLKKATQADSGFALAFAALGEAYLRKFDLTQDRSLLPQAESNASHALELNDSLARVHVVMGRVHKAFGRRELAEQEFLTASKLELNDADALSGLAGEYAANQRMQDAERLYRQAVALRPDSWDVYNNFGRFLLDQEEKPEEAAEQFRMVIERAPDSIAGYQNLAAALLQAGRIEEAERPLRKAVGMDNSSWAVHINLGDLYFRKGHLVEAEKETLRGIELNDKYWGNWANLGVLYRWWGRDDQAIAAYKHAIPLMEELLKVQDKDAATWAELAEMYAYLGDIPKYSAAMQKAMVLDPENPQVLLSSADVHEVLGERRLAVELANKAVANGLRLAILDTDPEARKFRTDPDFKPPGR